VSTLFSDISGKPDKSREFKDDRRKAGDKAKKSWTKLVGFVFSGKTYFPTIINVVFLNPPWGELQFQFVRIIFACFRYFAARKSLGICFVCEV